MGERVTRYAPHGGPELVDVCALCTEIAAEHGWVKEGSPTTPVVADRRRRRKGGIGRWIDDLRRPSTATPMLSEPILRRLSEDELAVVEAAELFNASDYRRTVGGIAKSLGAPRTSIVQLAGVNAELVITVAWDISWYQYRVTPDAAQPVRLEERGHDLAELGPQYQGWNAHLEDDGRVVPDIERL
jgi:hypothetical protein